MNTSPHHLPLLRVTRRAAAGLGLAVLVCWAGATAACGPRRGYQDARYGRGNPQQSLATTPRGDGWLDFTPPGTGATIALPGPPQANANQAVEDDGTAYTSTFVGSQTRLGSFVFAVGEFEVAVVGDPLAIAHEMSRTFLEHLELTPGRSTRLNIPGYYAREDIAQTQNGMFVAVRTFIGERRVYVAAAIVPNAPGPLSAAEHYMGAVRLARADALYAHAVGAEATPHQALYMPEDDFAVRMPAIAGIESSQLTTRGGAAAMRTYTGHAGAVFRVRVLAFEAEPSAEAVADVAQALSLGELSAPANASGFPGYQATNARLFITARRIYVLDVQGESPETDHFFESLRIL